MIEQLTPWLGYAAGFSLVLALLWLIRLRDRGPTALFMVAASLALAGLFEGMRQEWPMAWRAGFVAVFAVGVVGDYVARLKPPAEPEGRA